MRRIHLRLCPFIFGGLGFLLGSETSAGRTWAERDTSFSARQFDFLEVARMAILNTFDQFFFQLLFSAIK